MRLGKVLSSKNQDLNTRQVLSTRQMTALEVRNRALLIGAGLVSTEAPKDFTAWYCKAYRVLGEQKYMAIASAAKQPGVENSKTLFGWLLREEMNAAV